MFIAFKVFFIIYTIILVVVSGFLFYFKDNEDYAAMSNKFKMILIVLVFIWFGILFALMEFNK